MQSKFFILSYITAAIFLLNICLVFPQTPPYFHYTTSDGLASSTVYSSMQDKNGFMWFGTLNGLCKFDGKRFTTYKTSDGLNSNVITEISEGSNGELYIVCMDKGVNIFQNNIISKYFDIVDGQVFSYSRLLKSGKKFYMWHRALPLISFKEQNISGPNQYRIPLHNLKLLQMDQMTNGDIIALCMEGLYSLVNDSIVPLKINELDNRKFFSVKATEGNQYLLGGNGCIYLIKDNRLSETINIPSINNKEIQRLFVDKNDNIWFVVRGEGFFYIERKSGSVFNLGKKLGLENTQINYFSEDSEGNIWISTFGKGVYCLTNLYLKNYSEIDGLSNNNVQVISKIAGNSFVIGTFDGISTFIDGKIEILKDVTGKKLAGDVSDIQLINDTVNVLWSPESVMPEYCSFNGINYYTIVARTLLKTSSGLYLRGGWGNYISVSNSKNRLGNYYNVYLSGEVAHINRIYDIIEDFNKDIWVAAGNGVYRLKYVKDKVGPNAWVKESFQNHSVINTRINSICVDSTRKIWFAGTDGIASYDTEKKLFNTYTSLFGVDVSSATSITSDNRSRLWIGTMSGLYLFDGSSIKKFTQKNGLSSDEILSLFYDNETNLLYIGSVNGFSVFDISLYEKFSAPELTVNINSIKAGDSTYATLSNLHFNSDQDNIYIKFGAIKFSAPGTVRYRYRLNDKWEETGNDFLNLISLKHGVYNFEIKAKSQNTDWGKSTYLSFEIAPRFVDSLWFTIGIVFSILAASFSVILIWVKNKSKNEYAKLQITERINELEHQALSAMMNPHFIFNSLNSVQYLVNDKKFAEANDYIAMMAKLMRKNLESAGSAFISLQEEILKLRLYLELEKMRFQDKFSYRINIAPDVTENSILIPNMIIQPFVENSIWHGIINSRRKGLIIISFSFEMIEIQSASTKALIIKIEDNGIGINAASKFSKEDHISKGILIIEERLRLLSRKMQMPQPIMFEDLSTRDENSQGTEIIISLPPPLYKEII